MLLLTVSRKEFISHLENRIRVHRGRMAELAGHLSELKKIAKKIRADMAKADNMSRKVLRVKGREYRTIMAIGISGMRGALGPAGPAGVPGPAGPPSEYMDFESESQLLGKLESKEFELANEKRTLGRRVDKFSFMTTHLPKDGYELNLDEIEMLEFAGL